jgi:hypothetical protein
MAISNMGRVDQTLITGRTAYGKASDGRFYPVTVDANGNIVQSIAQTVQTELLASSAVAASVVIKSSELSLTGVRQATFFIDHGRSTTVGFGALGGTNYMIQGSEKATGNDTWRTLATFVASSAGASSALSSGAVAAAATSITILSGTAFVAGDFIMWANTAAPATSTEWARVTTVTGTASFTVMDGMTNAQGSTVVITNQAEHFVVTVDTGSLTRVRVVVNNTTGTTAIIRSRIAAITGV